MSRNSAYAQKQAKKAEFALNKELDTGGDTIDAEADMNHASRDAAMGKGEEELFEKKLSKEEKKAAAKAAREAKKKAKEAKIGKKKGKEEKKLSEAEQALAAVKIAEKKVRRVCFGRTDGEQPFRFLTLSIRYRRFLVLGLAQLHRGEA